jgi:peptide/nickel transport system substrate-binding protein
MLHKLPSPLVAVVLLLSAAASLPSFGQTLRIAMTASDIPTTTGIPNNGGEGFRFLGFPAFDGLINWDFTRPDQIAGLTPGLAASWKIDDSDHMRWVFSLRDGVAFHDGSAVTADAVIWNLDRFYNEKSPQFDAPASAIVRSFVNMLDRYQKIDDRTIAIYTKSPFSFFPYMVPTMLMVSPAQWEKAGRSWTEFGKTPSGTGPFRITKVVPGQFVEMSRNESYWDKVRVPKLAKLTVIPMPEATTRLAALRSGQVDWIEVPPPDAIPSLKAAGFQISLWPYPHVWPYIFNLTEKSAFRDRRVRQALNYAIDRDELVKFLNGTAKPAYGLYPPGNPYFGKPEQRYSHDPEKAKTLLAEAGYGPNHPLETKVMISTSGSGQMVPLPMNEILQQQVQPVGFKLDFDVVDWGTMLVVKRTDPAAAVAHGADALNNSLGFADPASMFRYFSKTSFSPNGINWGHYADPRVDSLLMQAQQNFDSEQQIELLAQAHAIVVDEAAWTFIVHDLNPRAMSSKVKGFQPAQSWYQDFTRVTVE